MPDCAVGRWSALTRASWTAVILGVVVLASCRKQSTLRRLFPEVPSERFSELRDSELSTIVVCHDTLGRPRISSTIDYEESRRCTPCLPDGIRDSATKSLAHARGLWWQGARAPYDSLDMGANCARLSYRFAHTLRPNDDSLAVEIALVHLANANDALRGLALASIDSTIDERIDGEHTAVAAHMLAQLAMGMWDRAQRQLERPSDISLHRLERDAHRLERGAPALKHLPTIPSASSRLGVSEAQWAARLFESAARLTTHRLERSRWLRLALAPWVVLEDWSALDSAAASLLRLAPNDSAVLPARALAAYRRMTRPVIESPAVMALFDSALAHVPRADSLRYDSFDGVLSAEDDRWRRGFLPSERLALERRGWSVLDPLWSTPVNEIRLSRRARIAEADYRHADIAQREKSGSETLPGKILVQRGSPTPRWRVVATRSDRHVLERSWPRLTAYSAVNRVSDTGADDLWRIFYGSQFSLQQASRYLPYQQCPAREQPFPSLHACATALRSEWDDVPFYGTTDEIDVTAARFRASADSADMYIGARVPLRAFKSRVDATADRTDRIQLGMWLSTELGDPIVHESVSRELPAYTLLAWTHQWTSRVGSARLMHRVEAIEPTAPSGARGIARFTSDAQVAFSMRGFGMSDVLVAAYATPRRTEVRRWSDLEVQPNGGTVAPNTRFAMVWEVYDLTPGPDGRVHWRVRIKRERGAVVLREDMKEVLVGSAKAGSRVLPWETDVPDLAYVRDASAGVPALENITFNLGDVRPGHHVVNVIIDDLVSGQSVTRGVSVRVLVPDSQKRGTFEALRSQRGPSDGPRVR